MTETYFQPITTSNFGPKIQQHEFSRLLAAAARDSPNGLRLDNASLGLRLAQLIQSVVRRLIPLPPLFHACRANSFEAALSTARNPALSLNLCAISHNHLQNVIFSA